MSALLKVVGAVTDENGMEKRSRFARPTDSGLTPERRWAAHILFTERFWEATVVEAAAVEGREHPPSRRMVGADRLRDFLDEMSELASKPNPTDGVDHMSRQSHADAAAEHVDAIWAIDALLVERLRQTKHDGDRRDIVQWFSDAVLHALDAGEHGQAARVKEWEPDALRGVKVVEGAQRARNREADEDRWSRMAAAVADEVRKGTKLTAAYEIVAERFSVSSRTAASAVKRVRKS